MKRTASEVLSDLEIRIARLEKQVEHDDHSIASLRRLVGTSPLSGTQKKELLKAFDKSALNYKARRLKREAQDIDYNYLVVERALEKLGRKRFDS